MKEKKIRIGKIRMRPDGLLEGVREERKYPSLGAGAGPCLLLALAITGCARVAAVPAPRPVMVEVPVSTPIYCQVPALQPPLLAIAALTPDSLPADTVRSYAASVDVLKSAVRERDAILAGCAAPAGTSVSPPSPGPNLSPSPGPQASMASPPAARAACGIPTDIK
jgi:hypothetical protein